MAKDVKSMTDAEKAAAWEAYMQKKAGGKAKGGSKRAALKALIAKYTDEWEGYLAKATGAPSKSPPKK